MLVHGLHGDDCVTKYGVCMLRVEVGQLFCRGLNYVGDGSSLCVLMRWIANKRTLSSSLRADDGDVHFLMRFVWLSHVVHVRKCYILNLFLLLR